MLGLRVVTGHSFVLLSASLTAYLRRAISSEPCFWQAKNMMRQVDARYLNRFRENPFWMQYTQCHYDWE